MKNKTKNIILGVSLGINILLALLVGGALIKSCNDAPKTKVVAGLHAGDDQGEGTSSAVEADQWYLNATLPNDTAFDYSDVVFFNNGYRYVRFAYDDERQRLYYGSVSVYASGMWNDEVYRTITFTDYGAYGTYLVSWLTNNATLLNSSGGSSSEQSSEVVSSSEDTTEDLTSEQTSAATSEGQPVDSLPSGFTLRFGERNPFSAWAENPKNEAPATSYDSNAPFVLYTGTASSETMGEVTAKYYTYEVGDFYVAGNPDAVFDTIAITTMNLSPDNYFLYNGGEDATLVGQEAYNKGAFIVANAYFLNSVTNARVQVLNMGMTSAKYGNTEIMALTNPSWANVGFRDIVYIGDNPQIEINGYTARASWWLENNALSSSAAVGSMLLGDATTGVFGLIGQAFTSITSIFGIALIPGLTIGTLLFIPLVVLIILAILRLLAK